MLGFFARFQKIILSIAGVAIIASMAFFGTYSTLSSSSKMKKSFRSESIDSRSINDADLRAIALFLEADATNPDTRGEPLFLLKSNWLSQNLIETGIAQKVISTYACDIQPTLSSKIKEHRQFKLYCHAQDKSLSLEKSINQFFPDFSAQYSSFMNENQKGFESDVDALFSLYRISTKIPMTWMKQILYYEQMQKKDSIEIDRNLEHRDIHLFRAQKMSDWFGPGIVDLLSQWVYNTAVFARGDQSYRGYTGVRVSLKEAEASLRALVQRNIKRTAGGNKIDVSADQMIERLSRAHNLLKEEMVSGWQKIMLMRRFFQDVGNISINSGMFKHLIDDAKIAKIKTFELDGALKSTSFYHVAKLDIYLKELCVNPEEQYSLQAFHDVEDLERMKSFLLAKRYKIKYAKTTARQASDEIALCEIFAFQIGDSGFNFLKKNSAALKKCTSTDQQERKNAIAKLGVNEKRYLDDLSCSEIIKDRQDLIRDLLVDQQMQGFEFYRTNSEQEQILPGIFHVDKLVRLLEMGLQDEDSRKALFCYSQDEEHYYRIELVETSNQEILSFKNANKLGILDHIIDNRLRPDYLILREQNPDFKHENGSYKTFPESRDLVAFLTYNELVDSIVKKAKLSEKTPSLVARHYFDDLVHANYVTLKKDEFKSKKDENPLKEQFSLLVSSRSVNQADPTHDPRVFSSTQKGFELSFDDFAYVYKKLSIENDTVKFMNAKREARRMLANEAKMNAALKVLDMMKSVKVVLYDQKS